jgi:hypothetical protein
MISAYIGSGGSGKTLQLMRYLFQINTVYETIIEDGKEKEVKVKKPVHRLYGRLILNVKGFNESLFREYSGNTDIEIIHHSKHWHKDDIEKIFKEQMKEDDKPESERIPTLLYYDECQFGLSTFSQATANLRQNEFIANFMSLHRHYGPCDIVLCTQSTDKINSKFIGDLDELFISLESNQKLDPENDIIFDQYDKVGKEIISGGRSKIKFKKLDTLKNINGVDFSPFELYTSGDAGRRPVKRKSFWGKFIYYFIAIMFFVFALAIWVFYSLFHNMAESAKIVKKELKPIESNTSAIPPTNTPIYQISGQRITKNVKKIDTQFDRYVEAPYNNIDGHILYRIFVNKKRCYLGKQTIKESTLNKLLKENIIFKIGEDSITKDSKYVNVLIHQSLLNSYQLLSDFDNTAQQSKSITKIN